MSDAAVNQPNDPQDVHTLAGEYVLGTLSAAQRREVERRLPSDPALRSAVQDWNERLLPLSALVAPVAPSAALWSRIERAVAPAPTAATMRPSRWAAWWGDLRLWRGLAGAGLAATVAMAVLLVPRLNPVPMEPRYMVVLVAPQDKAPGWVVQASDTQRLRLIPLGTVEVPPEKALQLWTKGDNWARPVSLGLVTPGQPLEVLLDKVPPLQPNQLFELTLEPPNGSPTGLPTGPIQHIGRMVKLS